MIEIRNLYKTFDDTDYVLRDINFKVDAGEFVVVLGQSGAGKSTLLRCLNYLTAPTSGELIVNGERCDLLNKNNRRALRKRVAMVFQHHNLIGRLSVIKNVLMARLPDMPFWSSLLQLFPRHDVRIACAALEQVGLAGKSMVRADTLSGGQQQRVGIARALAQQPDLILADEPIASLDPNTSRKILNCLRDACRQNNIAVICNLHQVEYATEFATRIIGLAAGQVVFDGVPESLTPKVIESIYPGVETDNILQMAAPMPLSGKFDGIKPRVARAI